ncbi:sodium/proline symporter PutP [Eubacterium barkeri]|uniref:Sodium/proline symporter n=1 Tax=Eubacterium barkeri TaxID=1528 RepID=A0A1H3HS50_EUBBA|nr:sodium/proline symporter PutP [Eubacterium barkeri]SDY18297.1 sodium/proline symporter [Eubacterium barkeri]
MKISGELVIFFVYLIVLIAIGLHFYKKSDSAEGFFLGGRGLGSWVTAFSAQASDMSGWLLMGLPGAIYLGGMPEVWIGIGLFIGTALNWKFVAARLRTYTEETGSLTLSTFLEKRYKDPTRAIRIVSALVILVFFTIYSASGMVASGKLFQIMFGVDYRSAVIIGGIVIVAYTFLGGFLAVCWTDLIQGVLMVIAITVVPILAMIEMGGLGTTVTAMAVQDIPINLFGNGISILAILSAVAWGLGYFGQPHILVRFMGIRSIKDLPKSMTIAIVWVIVSLAGAIFVGLLSIPLFPGLSDGSQETVFILMIRQYFPVWIGGIFLAAIMAAIMSTIDSQLLVSSSALTEDLWDVFAKKRLSDKMSVNIGRGAVVVIAVLAMLLALQDNASVMGLVSYAWSGFGAAFGPLVLFGLYSRKTTWQAALSGMIVGTFTVVIWKMTGMSSLMYEIVPGFLLNVIVILIVNRLTKPNPECMKEFDEMVAIVAAAKTEVK